MCNGVTIRDHENPLVINKWVACRPREEPKLFEPRSLSAALRSAAARTRRRDCELHATKRSIALSRSATVRSALPCARLKHCDAHEHNSFVPAKPRERTSAAFDAASRRCAAPCAVDACAAGGRAVGRADRAPVARAAVSELLADAVAEPARAAAYMRRSHATPNCSSHLLQGTT